MLYSSEIPAADWLNPWFPTVLWDKSKHSTRSPMPSLSAETLPAMITTSSNKRDFLWFHFVALERAYTGHKLLQKIIFLK